MYTGVMSIPLVNQSVSQRTPPVTHTHADTHADLPDSSPFPKWIYQGCNSVMLYPVLAHVLERRREYDGGKWLKLKERKREECGTYARFFSRVCAHTYFDFEILLKIT